MENQNFRTVRITVSGFDFTLPRGDIKKTLIEVFSSCGEIVHYDARVRSRFAKIFIEGACAKEKALQLSGTASDVGILRIIDVSVNVIRPDVAALRRAREIRSSSKIFAQGFDTTLPKDDIKIALANLFSSCGEIIDVFIPMEKSPAIVSLMGEGAKEKAMELNGSDMGGWTLTVMAMPAPISVRSQIKESCTRVAVSGYDTSLREDVIEAALYNLFESCGNIFEVTVTTHHGTGTLNSKALVFIRGDAAEEALQLNGILMGGGRKLVVVVEALPVQFQEQETNHPRLEYGLPPNFFQTAESSASLSY